MTTADRISSFFSATGDALKSIAKMIVESRRNTVAQHDSALGDTLVILANGPSLRQTMQEHADMLASATTMAVNFAANTEEFQRLRPALYVLADPHFFRSEEPNVQQLWQHLREAEWSPVLYVPAKYAKRARELAPEMHIEKYNAVGVEGWRWLRHAAYKLGLGMPRPHNVLIAAIMVAIQAGFKEIYLTGADHSWLQTLSVGDDNAVLSIQPHYYADEKRELRRSAADYRGRRLHTVLRSFSLAFQGYHLIADYAATRGIRIFNSTPGSFIDAFPRKPFAE